MPVAKQAPNHAASRASTASKFPPPRGNTTRVDPNDRPEHNYLLFGRDPGAEVPTYAHAVQLRNELGQYYERAAQALCRADAVLVCTGAGFSADSKLAVYKDVADIPAYHKQGLTYYDLCHLQWLKDDPSIFYGFWGR